MSDDVSYGQTDETRGAIGEQQSKPVSIAFVRPLREIGFDETSDLKTRGLPDRENASFRSSPDLPSR
jgi:hypothetical protein